MQLETRLSDVVTVLGLRTDCEWSLVSIADALQRGLPLESLTRVQWLLADQAKAYTRMIVTEPTLKRRQKNGQALSSEESQRLQRAARVWTMAMSVYHNEEHAREFLTRDHMLLDNRPPLAVAIATDVGTEAVEGILGRLKYGTAA
jgi:putative toxin-antitoxin system antitoxin component (TIGR02293 family)